MHADLDTLCTVVYCTAADLLPAARKNARRRITDAEVVTLCVAQAIMGIPSDRLFLRTARRFRYDDADGAAQALQLAAGELAFTFCQVPVVYRLGRRAAVQVAWQDGKTTAAAGDALAAEALVKELGEGRGR